MKSKLLNVVSFCLIALMLIPTVFTSISAEGVYDPTSKETTTLGATFDSKTTATMEKILPSLPHTYEAEIQINSTSRGGVILGNYSGSGKCISFEISTNGQPRIYTAYGNSATSTIFNKVNVLSTEVVRLTITVDEANNMAHCYLNGELKQTIAINYPITYEPYISSNRQNLIDKPKSAELRVMVAGI